MPWSEYEQRYAHELLAYLRDYTMTKSKNRAHYYYYYYGWRQRFLWSAKWCGDITRKKKRKKNFSVATSIYRRLSRVCTLHTHRPTLISTTFPLFSATSLLGAPSDYEIFIRRAPALATCYGCDAFICVEISTIAYFNVISLSGETPCDRKLFVIVRWHLVSFLQLKTYPFDDHVRYEIRLKWQSTIAVMFARNALSKCSTTRQANVCHWLCDYVSYLPTAKPIIIKLKASVNKLFDNVWSRIDGCHNARTQKHTHFIHRIRSHVRIHPLFSSEHTAHTFPLRPHFPHWLHFENGNREFRSAFWFPNIWIPIHSRTSETTARDK